MRGVLRSQTLLIGPCCGVVHNTDRNLNLQAPPLTFSTIL